MNITETGGNYYNTYQNSGIASVNQTQKTASDAKHDDAGSQAKKSHLTAVAVDISGPRVSDAVNRVLLRLQETGGVFDRKDAQLMNVRGVSDGDRQRFAEIIDTAANNGAYNDPVSYVKTLSSEDVNVLRRVHSLAENTGVTDTRTTEGAINLLLPPQDHVDTDNNGLVSNGTATGFRFPPPNAPQSVKDAWDAITSEMSLEEKMMAEAAFFPAMISANIKTNSSGKPIGIYEPTDPEYTNIFGTTQGDWNSLLQKTIKEYQEAVKRSPELQPQLDMLLEFVKDIESSGEANTLVQGSTLGQSTSPSDPVSHGASQGFLDNRGSSPEVRNYESLLAEEGFTNEQLAILPPEE